MEVKNRRENLFIKEIPPTIRDPDKIIADAVKEVSKLYKLSKASYTELKDSLGKPAIYYADFSIPWGVDDGTPVYRTVRLYMIPSKPTEENKIEFYANFKWVNTSNVGKAGIMCLTATSGDTPASRIGEPYYL